MTRLHLPRVLSLPCQERGSWLRLGKKGKGVEKRVLLVLALGGIGDGIDN
jgi:hypothetical protein